MARDSRAQNLTVLERSELKYSQSSFVSLKNHVQFNEAWLQNKIAENPEILGLGELEVVQRERQQLRAGRLDLLLSEVQRKRRYAVEIQLGTVDESHIIRTIEYWDIERRRYPQIDHYAVICAEEITGRFLNVISLFNGHIPLIALQIKAVQMDDRIGLVFTKVLDVVELGLPDETVPQEASRAWWETKVSKEPLVLLDQVVPRIREVVGHFDLKYNKPYVGCVVGNKSANFILFRPQKGGLRIDVGMELSKEQIEKLEAVDIEVMEYIDRWDTHAIRLRAEQAASIPLPLLEVIKEAYDNYFK